LNLLARKIVPEALLRITAFLRQVDVSEAALFTQTLNL